MTRLAVEDTNAKLDFDLVDFELGFPAFDKIGGEGGGDVFLIRLGESVIIWERFLFRFV